MSNKRSRETAPAQLAVMGLTETEVSNHHNALITGIGKSGNDSLPPLLRSLTDTALLFPQATAHGHCWYAATRKQKKGGPVVESIVIDKKDSPR